MTREDLLLQRPRGTKDYLPQEARLIRQIGSIVGEVFRLWGYSEVITPTFEYIEVLRQGTGPDSDEMIFRFFDREGHTLGLRSDATTPIARLAATRFDENHQILRLAYLTNIFRYLEPGMGREREFHQGGVELIGSRDPRADAEVIHLAATVFEELGISGYRLDLGETSFSLGLLESSGLNSKEQKQIRTALLNKDYVLFNEILASPGIPESSRTRLQRLPSLRGGVEVLTRAGSLTSDPVSVQALNRLNEVCSLLPKQVLKRVQIDLGMAKDFEYYTGLIFEGYVADMGYTVCTGGRYDSLIGRFGLEKPAIGFGFGLERLVELLQTEHTAAEPKVVCVTYQGASRSEAQELAERLRGSGYPAVLGVTDADRASKISVQVEPDGSFELISPTRRERYSTFEELIRSLNNI